MATKIENAIRARFMEDVKNFLIEKGADVLQVKSGTYSIPWVEGDEQGYLNISFIIPKGQLDKENKTYIPYDGDEEAQNYTKESAKKAEKKAETARRRAEKKAKDEANRAEAKRKREEADARRKGEDA